MPHRCPAADASSPGTALVEVKFVARAGSFAGGLLATLQTQMKTGDLQWGAVSQSLDFGFLQVVLHSLPDMTSKCVTGEKPHASGKARLSD